MAARRPISGAAFAALAALALLVSVSARAHEFWIEPVAPLPETGGEIRAHLRVGQMFSGDVYPYLSSRFNFFRVFVRGEAFDLPGTEGDLPAVGLPNPKPGLNVIAFFGKPNKVTFDDPAVFATYLETEDLGWVAAAHQARGLPPVGFTEAFSRTVKTLVQVGPVSAADRDIAVGMPFELIAGENPYAVAASEALPVTLLWQGEPAANTQIAIFRDRGSVERSVVRTDAEGRATVPTAGGGKFLISAVHMREASPDLEAAWESHWASLTFSLAPR